MLHNYDNTYNKYICNIIIFDYKINHIPHNIYYINKATSIVIIILYNN